MASVKKSDIPNEAQMMSMLWEMIKDFYIPDDNQKYHAEFCERAREIDKKCQSRLGQKFINAFGDYLDEKIRGERDGG